MSHAIKHDTRTHTNTHDKLKQQAICSVKTNLTLQM